jgi:mannitol/fructose-specific phosphotransferase system IIA component (Ntr-type)
LQWVAQTAEKVKVVFLLAVPGTNFGAYLTVIAGLARLNKDSGLRESFVKARDSFEMFEILKQVKVRASLASA